jgi:hypothetical protein
MKKNLLCIFITVILISSTSLFGENNNDVCVELIEQYDTPQIRSEAISPDSIFQLIVNDNGSVTLKNIALDTKMIISPEVDGSAQENCGSVGCDTPEQRALFTPDGRYAITTSSFKGGPTIIWETTNWTDIRENFNNNEQLGGGYFRLSPNGQYLAILRYSWKFGSGLSLVDFDNFTSKIISGTYWTKDLNQESGLKFNGNSDWLDDFIGRPAIQDYNFSFSNDSRTLIIRDKRNSNEYILYDVIKHSLSRCSLGDNQIPNVKGDGEKVQYTTQLWNLHSDGFYGDPSIISSIVVDSDSIYERLTLSIDCFYSNKDRPHLFYTSPNADLNRHRWWEHVGGQVQAKFNSNTYRFGRSTSRGDVNVFVLSEDDERQEFINALITAEDSGVTKINFDIIIDGETKSLFLPIDGFTENYEKLKCEKEDGSVKND